jgi:hypothetical protein
MRRATDFTSLVFRLLSHLNERRFLKAHMLYSIEQEHLIVYDEFETMLKYQINAHIKVLY